MSIDAFLIAFAALALAAIVIYALTSDGAMDRSSEAEKRRNDRSG